MDAPHQYQLLVQKAHGLPFRRHRGTGAVPLGAYFTWVETAAFGDAPDPELRGVGGTSGSDH